MEPDRTMGDEQHIASVFESIAADQPNALALACGDTTRTWAEFDQRADRLATQLLDWGLRPGVGIGICLRNSNEYLESYFGIMKARCVPINVNYRYVDGELASLLDDADCRVLIFGSTFSERIAKIDGAVESLEHLVMVDEGTGDGAPASVVGFEECLSSVATVRRIPRESGDTLVAYTGGTTGLPKGLTYTVASRVTGRAAQYAQMLRLPGPPKHRFDETARELATLGTAPVGLPASPLMHGTALVTCALPTLLFGGCVVTVPSVAYDPDLLLDTVAARQVTSISLVGDAMARPLVEALNRRANSPHPHRVDSVRAVVSSGMSWSATTKAGLLEHMAHATLIEVFGATEGLMGTARTARGDAIPEFPAFVPVAGLRILRDDDSDADPGEVGRIAFPVDDSIHYRDDEAKTAQNFRWIDGCRYAVLGDLGTVHPDGLLEPLGRSDHVINTGGEKVYPAEVEDVLRQLGEVADCTVVGVPDPRWGQAVTALVSLSSRAMSVDLIRQHLAQHLAAYKVPKAIAVVDAVPRHPNGKTDHQRAAALVATHLAERTSASATPMSGE